MTSEMGTFSRRARLHVDVRDEWPVADLWRFLRDQEAAYDRLAAFFMNPGYVIAELGSVQTSPPRQTTHVRYQYHPQLERVLWRARKERPALQLGAIKISSPGFSEVLGALNPLKVAADFATAFRAENTKRILIQQDAENHRETVRVQAETAAKEMETRLAIAEMEMQTKVFDALLDYAASLPSEERLSIGGLIERNVEELRAIGPLGREWAEYTAGEAIIRTQRALASPHVTDVRLEDDKAS